MYVVYQFSLAEKNTPHTYIRTAQPNSSKSDMNDQHQMCEPHQQHYSPPAMYHEYNDVEQSKSLVRSMVQNPHMLNDFYQFLEFTRARSAQQSFQSIYNGPINQDQQQISSILNIKINIQHQSSTPKHSRPLNESEGSISSVLKQHKPNEYTPM